MLTKKKKFKKRGRSLLLIFYTFLGVLVLVIIGFLIDANIKIGKKRSELLAQISFLEQQLQKMEELKRLYERGLEFAQTEEFWEEKLREQGYKKPGEEVFVVLPQEKKPQEKEKAEEEQIQEEKSFWRRFLEKIGF